jgi:hypothetical protein
MEETSLKKWDCNDLQLWNMRKGKVKYDVTLRKIYKWQISLKCKFHILTSYPLL